MGGMRKVPPGTYRRRGSDERPPRWWEHYYHDPESGQHVLLGRSERLGHLRHRFYPVAGDSWPEVHSFVDGVGWLLGLHFSRQDRSEEVTVTETGNVTVAEG